MRKILIFNSGSCLYGSEKGLINIVKALYGKYDITVVLPRGGLLVKFLLQYSAKVKIHPLGILTFSFSPFFYVKFFLLSVMNFFYFTGYALINKVDILYANNSLIIFPVFTAFFLRKKHIWHIREFFHLSLVNKFISLLARKFSSGIICQSQNIKNVLFPLGGSNISVIYEGIDLRNTNIALQENLLAGIPEGTVVLSIISRIHPLKGQYEFVKSLKELCDGIKKNVVLFIAGDISPANLRNRVYKRKIESFVKRNHLSDRVFFLGFKEDIENIFSFSDICIFPFLRNEPFGIALLEALVFSQEVFVNFNQGFREIDSFFKGKCKELSLAALKETIEKGEFTKKENIHIPDVFTFEAYKKNINSFVIEVENGAPYACTGRL